MHVFKYSPRKGTKAAVMPNQIPGDVKEKRSRELLLLSDKNEDAYQKEYIGKRVNVLFEEKDNDGYYKGHTANYIVVKVKTDIDLINKIETVLIIGNENQILVGQM